MATDILTAFEPNTYSENIARAAEVLRSGGLVVFPTETVYGIAANAKLPEAVARLRSVKRRSDQEPFTVHIATRSDARRFVRRPGPLVRRLVRKAWPGPLTLTCEVQDGDPANRNSALAHAGLIGLRCPDHAVAERLLSDAGDAIVASSANRAGNAPPNTLEHALRDLDGEVDLAIDAGRTRFNGPSTVVEVRGPRWSIQREGVIARRTIERMATTEILFVCTGNSCRSPLGEFLFRHKLAKRLGMTPEEMREAGYVIGSAGTIGNPGVSMSPGSLEQLSRRGIDGSSHRAQPLTIELLQRCERIFAMSPEHREAVVDIMPAAADRVVMLDPDGPVPDPVGGGDEEYRRSAEHIERVVDARLEEFVNEDCDW